MKYYFLIISALLISFNSFSQRKTKKLKHSTQTDTLFVFQSDEFREINTYWTEGNEVGIMQKSYSTSKSYSGKGIELTLIFKNWSSFQKNKIYPVDSVPDLIIECTMKQHLFTESFASPKGEIMILESAADKIKIQFDFEIVSLDRSTLLMFQGTREFKSDY
jgi:hypothetical protein